MLRFRQQLVEIEIDAGDRPIRFLREGFCHIERSFVLVAVDEDDGQYEFVLLIQPVEDFVAGDGDSAAAFDATLDLYVA